MDAPHSRASFPVQPDAQRGQPWNLRRLNADGTGIPVVWRRERGHAGSEGRAPSGVSSLGFRASVLELQLVQDDGSEQIAQSGSSGDMVLGYLEAPGLTGREEAGPASEDELPEQTSINISGINFQYWLTSQPDRRSDGLDVLLEFYPGVNRHLVQSTKGILPGFRYWFLKCDRFQCLVGDVARDDLPMRADELHGIETIGFLAWLGLDSRHYTTHITPTEFRYPPDPWLDRLPPPLTGLDMSWYPSGDHDEDPDDLPYCFMCQYIAFSSSAARLHKLIPNFRLIACRDAGGYTHGVIQIDKIEYAYYDDSREHVFFLGEDWDDAIDKVWVLEKWQEPEGMKFYTLDDFQHRGLQEILYDVRSERNKSGHGGEME